MRSHGWPAARPAGGWRRHRILLPNGQTWQYAATIGAAGGFRPAVVKGSGYGFVVTGTDAAGNYLAYASTGSATASLPTGSPGVAASYASAPAATVGPGGIVIAAGPAATTTTGQQAILLRASTAGAVQPVLPGVAIPQWRSTAWPWPAVSRSPWAAPMPVPS